LSFNELSGNTYLDIINERKNLRKDYETTSLTTEKARKSFTMLNVYYDSLTYTQMTESPQMDIIALLASIGGNLGLFLGVSVFSLCEVFQALIEIYLLRQKD
jgi:hypothetical protein